MRYLKPTGKEGQQLRPVILAEFDILGSPVYAHTGFGTLELDGKEFLGVGDYGGISTASAGSDLSRQTITATLTGIPNHALDMNLVTVSENYQGRNASIRLAMLDDDWNLVGDMVSIYDGRMDVCTAEQGETSSVSVSVENYLSDWDRARVSLYTDQEQQRLHPGDKFFEFVPQMQSVELPWGVED